MGWKQVLEFESSASSLDDNPFACTRTQPTGKLPADEWLCRKIEKWNITVTKGYPTFASETAGLSRDHFIRFPKILK